MTSVGIEILWSPVHEDKFVTWCPDLHLYEVGPVPVQEQPVKGSQSCLQMSETTQAVLLATNSSYRYARCVDIHPKHDDILLAVGLANGKVVLTSFGVSPLEVIGREFAPTAARQCNSVLWNQWDSNILAAALDKSRADHAVLLWDAFGCSHADKPVREFGMGDSGNSLAWINNHCLAVGISNKWIKVMDRRDSSLSACTQTKAVYGISASPYNDELLVSFFDTQICVWDRRNFEKPITTAVRQKNVTKILWCPTRHNLLGSLQRDSVDIVLYDLQLTAVGNEEVEPTLLERSVSPCPAVKVTSFSWHPTIESRLITISQSGNVVIDYYVLERITLNWFPSSNLVWTHGRRTMKVISDRDPIYQSFEDISILIKKRALADYGLKPDLWQNGELADDSSLKHLWYWLYASRSLVEEGIIKGSVFHPGVLSILSSDRKSEVVHPSSLDTAWPSIKIYRSEDRDSALQLCGWRYEKRDVPSLTNFLERLFAEGDYTRAAAIAVFNLRLNLAISILNRGANRKKKPELSTVAMALSGFPGDAWKIHCSIAGARLPDPYLRAIFAFLTSDQEKYDGVLNESEISVDDRIAFACTFLSDTKLSDYLLKLSDKLIDEGDLAGIVLTGCSLDGVKLLQGFLDKTSDVQSVALLAVRGFPYELQQDPNVVNWIRSYQALLDSLKLWSQRAHFDIALNERNGGEKVPQQVFISCNFCQKSICSFVHGLARARSGGSRLGPTSLKVNMSSCPNCRKPLPRCAICLMHVGTPSRLNVGKTADLASWFTWCQTCRHGGHMEHVQQWFASHSECPVTGCSCRCLSLDGATACS